METINISTLKARLSEIIAKVRNGEKFTIYDRKVAVALLAGLSSDRDLEVTNIAEAKFSPPKSLKSPSRRILKRDVVALLREDRDRK